LPHTQCSYCYYVRQGCYVMPGVCLSVCLFVYLTVSNFTENYTEGIFTKILPHMYLGIRKNWLISGSHPPPDPDPGHFSTIWLISPERVIEFSWKFYHRCSLEQGSPRYILEIIQTRSRPYSPWRTYAVRDCSCYTGCTSKRVYYAQTIYKHITSQLVNYNKLEHRLRNSMSTVTTVQYSGLKTTHARTWCVSWLSFVMSAFSWRPNTSGLGNIGRLRMYVRYDWYAPTGGE